MNLFFVMQDGSIVTPELTGTILEGVTRDSIIDLAKELGHDVSERRISIDEWREGLESGAISEVFACGTAAVVTPVGRLAWEGGHAPIHGGEVGAVTAKVRSSLLDIQYGRAEDTHGWMHRVL
jgi:branched-chain amino acid aminotransferase